MPQFTEEEIRAYEQRRRDAEESELSLVRKLMDFTRMWEYCENRACRRARGCRDARTCQEMYAEGILWWKREMYVPYLRERYPTVQWGGPPDIVRPQYEAALAAEADEEARRQGRANPSPAESRGGKKRAKKHPLYDRGMCDRRAGARAQFRHQNRLLIPGTASAGPIHRHILPPPRTQGAGALSLAWRATA